MELPAPVSEPTENVGAPAPVPIPNETVPVQDDEEVVRLVEQLRAPNNRVRWLLTLIPGGEILEFSTPMEDLIRLGGRSRPVLHKYINDPQIQNEVVLVLGAVGDRTTVSLLIEAYPEADLREAERDDPRRMTEMCFAFALPYLTGQEIGRDREGADFEPGNRARWKQWLARAGTRFTVPVVKPNATWVPKYPDPGVPKPPQPSPHSSRGNWHGYFADAEPGAVDLLSGGWTPTHRGQQ
jgi:hypothetical protein